MASSQTVSQTTSGYHILRDLFSNIFHVAEAVTLGTVLLKSHLQKPKEDRMQVALVDTAGLVDD